MTECDICNNFINNFSFYAIKKEKQLQSLKFKFRFYDVFDDCEIEWKETKGVYYKCVLQGQVTYMNKNGNLVMKTFAIVDSYTHGKYGILNTLTKMFGYFVEKGWSLPTNLSEIQTNNEIAYKYLTQLEDYSFNEYQKPNGKQMKTKNTLVDLYNVIYDNILQYDQETDDITTTYEDLHFLKNITYKNQTRFDLFEPTKHIQI